MTIYFCETEYHYQSYDDWYQLARLSGYEVIPIAQMDVLNPDHIYIVNHFGAVGMPGNEHEAKARIILWQLEWAKLENKEQYPSNISEVWASDKWFAEYYGARYLLLGSHKDLSLTPPDPNGNRGYDIALMMYRGPYRRGRIIGQLEEAGVKIAPDGWDAERHATLLNSRCMLHIHQHDDVATVAPLRFAIAAAYKLTLISETCKDAGKFNSVIYQVGYDDLVQRVQHLITVPLVSERLYDFLCEENSFRKCVEGML